MTYIYKKKFCYVYTLTILNISHAAQQAGHPHMLQAQLASTPILHNLPALQTRLSSSLSAFPALMLPELSGNPPAEAGWCSPAQCTRSCVGQPCHQGSMFYTGIVLLFLRTQWHISDCLLRECNSPKLVLGRVFSMHQGNEVTANCCGIPLVRAECTSLPFTIPVNKVSFTMMLSKKGSSTSPQL